MWKEMCADASKQGSTLWEEKWALTERGREGNRTHRKLQAGILGWKN